MYQLNIYPKAILRIPRFPINSTLKDNWEALKQLILDASPDFYELIKELDYDGLLKADDKIRYTVAKYFNRACFRATPFAAFATVSMTAITDSGSSVTIDSAPLLHTFPDWSLASVSNSHLIFFKQPGVKLFANSSYYCLHGEMRFLQKRGDQLQLTAIDDDPDIINILKACNTPVTFDQLYQKAGNQYSIAMLDELVSNLLDIQLLISSLHTNIIGEDYFKRVQLNLNAESPTYIIAERTSAGTLNRQLFRHLPELANHLHKLPTAIEVPDLEAFKQAFTRRFEQAEIPIMQALDPEAGVGYGSRERNINSPELEAVIGQRPEEKYNFPARDMFYREILKNKDTGVIDLANLASDKPSKTFLPNTVTAACTIVDDTIWLDSLGGATATAVSGRFALAIPEVEVFCKDMAALEREANPDVLLFDIGYTKEGHIDNVNRRPCIYDWQLNILNFDTSENPLMLTDIYVSVLNGEVVLRSRSLNKRLLPRIASAYNYNRSDLSVFRLLMDIQNQNLHVNLSFRLPDLIPGLDYYPRLQFKNIIISPATWRLSFRQLGSSGNLTEKAIFLQSWLLKKVNATHIKTGNGDRTLCLTINNIDDMVLLATLLLKQKELLVEEAAAPKMSIVTDTNAEPYFPQIIVALTHSDPIVHPFSTVQQSFPALAPQQVIAPGKDWLYFEIHSHPFRANELLERIRYYIDLKRSAINKWFFIRYNEGGAHIRLRIQLNNAEQAYVMIGEISHLFNAELKSGIISDIRLCTYKPEIHRYLPEHIKQVEHHFYIDSEFALTLLPDMLPDYSVYKVAIKLFETVRESGVIEPHAIEHLVSKMKNAYNSEHHVQQPQFKIINSRFKAFRQEAEVSLSINSAALYEQLKLSVINTLSAYPKLIRPKIMADLVHMHINRLFVSEQRIHEMIIYNFLELIIKSRRLNVLA